MERQVSTLIILAWLLCGDGQLDAAEEAALRAIDLLPEKGNQIWVHAALEIAPSLGRVDQLVWVHFGLAEVFLEERKFGDANRSRSITHPFSLAHHRCRPDCGMPWRSKI